MSPVQLRGVTLGKGRTKVIVPVTASTSEELVAQTTTLAGVKPDIIEWRVDFLDAAPSPVAVLEVAARIRIVARDRPVVFTFRSHHENGNKPITPDEYHDLNIAALYCDRLIAILILLIFLILMTMMTAALWTDVSVFHKRILPATIIAVEHRNAVTPPKLPGDIPVA